MLKKWIADYMKRNDGYEEPNGSLNQLRVLTGHLSNGSSVPFRNNEYFLKALFDCITEAVIIIDETGEIVFGNSSCEDILGWTSEEIATLNIERIIPSFSLSSCENGYPRLVVHHVVAKDTTVTEREIIISCFENGKKGWVLTMESDNSKSDRFSTDLSLWKQHFRTIMESSQDCIFAWDANMRFIYANKATKQHFLIDEKKIQGKPVEEVVNKVDGFCELWRGRTKLCMEEGKPQTYSDTFEIAGRSVFGSSNIAPILNNSGEIVAFSVSYRDETEKVLNQKREDEIVNVYKSLSHLLSEMVFICSNDGVIVFANAKASEKFQKEDSDQMRGVPFLSIVAEDDREHVEQVISQTISSMDQPPVLTQCFLSSQGEKSEYEILIAPVIFAGQTSFVTVMRSVELIQRLKEPVCPFRLQCVEIREELCQLADKLGQIHRTREVQQSARPS